MCCGVIPILFGWFLSVSSLHVLVFIWKTFCDFCVHVYLAMEEQPSGGMVIDIDIDIDIDNADTLSMSFVHF